MKLASAALDRRFNFYEDKFKPASAIVEEVFKLHLTDLQVNLVNGKFPIQESTDPAIYRSRDLPIKQSSDPAIYRSRNLPFQLSTDPEIYP